MPGIGVVPTVSPGSTGTGPTRLDYRNVLGMELGWWHAYTVATAASGSPDATRIILLAELEDDEEAADRLIGAYAYLRTLGGQPSGEQRRIVRRGYDGPNGAITLSRPLDDAVAVNDIVEISRPLPVEPHMDRKGLNTLINEALARCWVEARITLAGNGTGSISLASYPWLTAYEHTRGIYDRRDGTPTTSPATRSPYPYSLRLNGAVISLVPAPTQAVYGDGEALELAVAVPADHLIFDGSAWSYTSTPGLSNDAYQAAVPIHWVRAFGMVKALQHLIALTMQDATLTDARRTLLLTSYQERVPTYARAAARIAQNEFPAAVAESSSSLVGGASIEVNQGVVWGGWPA